MNRSGMYWLVLVFGIPIAVLMTGLGGVLSPIGLGLGLLFAAVYLVAGVLLFRAGPLWPSAGGLYVLSCLAWGAGVSLALVALPSTAWLEITDKLGWEVLAASFGGAYPEEIAKAAGVLLILYCSRRLNRPWHGFVTGGLVGLGFEVNENLSYGAMGALLDANSDFAGVLAMWGMRAVAGPGLHVALTAIAGWGIGQAMFQRKSLSKLWWIGAAMLLHFLWNVMPASEELAFVQYGVLTMVIYPLFIWLYVKCVRLNKIDNSYVLLM
ncbi:PrsW family intramembrane metalloprotease [Corynebacterium sp. H127]|uniref:PrsW family intramembrane metalloprotease n=1 Tax=Corynebacterium sp. H127 TaxID=3133418 RepID=UPI0030AC2797